MLGKLFDLLPAAIVREIGKRSFANLVKRQRIKTWIVIENPESENRVSDRQDYLGFQFNVSRSFDGSWDWFVCDGCGIDLIETGREPTELEAIASAKNWVDGFLNDGDIEGCSGD